MNIAGTRTTAAHRLAFRVILMASAATGLDVVGKILFGKTKKAIPDISQLLHSLFPQFLSGLLILLALGSVDLLLDRFKPKDYTRRMRLLPLGFGLLIVREGFRAADFLTDRVETLSYSGDLLLYSPLIVHLFLKLNDAFYPTQPERRGH